MLWLAACSAERALERNQNRIAFLFLSAIGVALMGRNVGKYIIGFRSFTSRLASHVIAGNATMNYWGLEYVILLSSSDCSSATDRRPGWLMEAVKPNTTSNRARNPRGRHSLF